MTPPKRPIQWGTRGAAPSAAPIDCATAAAGRGPGRVGDRAPNQRRMVEAPAWQNPSRVGEENALPRPPVACPELRSFRSGAGTSLRWSAPAGAGPRGSPTGRSRTTQMVTGPLRLRPRLPARRSLGSLGAAAANYAPAGTGTGVCHDRWTPRVAATTRHATLFPGKRQGDRLVTSPAPGAQKVAPARFAGWGRREAAAGRHPASRCGASLARAPGSLQATQTQANAVVLAKTAAVVSCCPACPASIVATLSTLPPILR
mmetsp:Transcript_45583/g.120489  ORF Transcript_45583/g.120489 Transcript_45583/m.120489 type:complete len:259 (-) Transcript_45583:2134-2910(-)